MTSITVTTLPDHNYQIKYLNSMMIQEIELILASPDSVKLQASLITDVVLINVAILGKLDKDNE